MDKKLYIMNINSQQEAKERALGGKGKNLFDCSVAEMGEIHCVQSVGIDLSCLGEKTARGIFWAAVLQKYFRRLAFM